MARCVLAHLFALFLWQQYWVFTKNHCNFPFFTNLSFWRRTWVSEDANHIWTAFEARNWKRIHPPYCGIALAWCNKPTNALYLSLFLLVLAKVHWIFVSICSRWGILGDPQETKAFYLFINTACRSQHILLRKKTENLNKKAKHYLNAQSI